MVSLLFTEHHFPISASLVGNDSYSQVGDLVDDPGISFPPGSFVCLADFSCRLKIEVYVQLCNTVVTKRIIKSTHYRTVSYVISDSSGTFETNTGISLLSLPPGNYLSFLPRLFK